MAPGYLANHAARVFNRAVDDGLRPHGLTLALIFYFDVLRQIRTPRWRANRAALVGDAAWRPTPLTRIGTSLAMIGGYVIAGELANDATPAAAFARASHELKLPSYRG